MKILYVHHAERDRKNKSVERQFQDITENGIKEADLLAEKLKQINIKAIYTAFKYTPSEVEERIENNKEIVEKFLEEENNITVRDLTKEESEALSKGELTEEEIVEKLIEKKEIPKDNKPVNNQEPKKEEEKTEEDNNVSQAIAQAIAKLYIQKNTYLSKLDVIEKEATKRFWSLKDQTTEVKRTIIAEYLPRVAEWETECDNIVYSILDEVREVVKKSGQDESIVKKLEEAYLNEKTLKKSYFISRYSD